MTALLFAWLAAAATSAPAPSPPAEPAAVRVEHRPGVTGFYATAPGRILSVVAPLDANGGRKLILLVAPETEQRKQKNADADPQENPVNDPCSDSAENLGAAAPERRPRLLMQFDATGAGALRTVRTDLPSDARGLFAVDVDANGRDDLVLTRSTSLAVLLDDGAGAWSGAPETVSTYPEEEATTPRIGAVAPGPAGASLWMTDLGAVRSFARNGAGSWRELPRIPIPLAAAKKEAALILSGVSIKPLDERDPQSPLATGPESLGGDRLRTVVIRPGAAEGERRAECWSHLPSAEKTLEAAYLNVAGAPALLVTTRPADKLSFFGEKLVRLFPLASDRTRKGKAPLAAFASGANLWQQIHPALADVSGDGRQDLIVAYWKGLKDDTVVLEAFLGKSGGTFETRARTTAFDVEDADRGVLAYGEDFDGTGLPDLILQAQGELQFYPGSSAADAGKRIVAARPSWSIPLPGAAHKDTRMEISLGSDGFDASSRNVTAWSLRPLDLDGDGRAELLCTSAPGIAANSLAIVRPAAR